MQHRHNYEVALLAALTLVASFPATAANISTASMLANAAPKVVAESATTEISWLDRFYAERNMKTVWVNKRSAKSRLKKYLHALERASDFGLDPEDYGYSALASAAEIVTPATYRKIDRIASRSFVNFALDVRDGRVSPKLDFTSKELAGRDLSRGEIMNAAVKNKDPRSYLSSLRRDNPVQASLTKALMTYQTYAETGAWKPIIIDADKLEFGATGDAVEAVASRLRAEGFFDGDVSKKTITVEAASAKAAPKKETVAHYDQNLAAAVQRFQKSRGIVPDGIVGPNTLEKMNVPAEALVKNIRLNLERARWLPQDFSERYVLVNIARFTVGLYEKEKLQQEIKTVVGKYHQQTPVFAGSMSYVVFNPYWNVPSSILRNEIAPQAMKDKDYLTKKNFEAVRGWDDDSAKIVDPRSIDWKDVIAGQSDIRVRQKPGPTNALGRVKFMFPNDYAVYLHDTPAQSLFERTDRAFSHGCIRLDEPVKFAEWVFSKTPGWDKAKINEILANEQRETIPLATEIPVYVTYFTAWAELDGDAYFLDDVYNRDDKLAAALKRAAPVLEVAETDIIYAQ